MQERINEIRIRMVTLADEIKQCAKAIQEFATNPKYKISPCTLSLKILVEEYRKLACEIEDLYRTPNKACASKEDETK